MNHIYIDKEMNINQMGLQAYQFEDTVIYIDGLIYAYGKKAGSETATWLFEKIQNDGHIPYEELRGAFNCIIKEKDKVTAFSDNSNMHCLYYTDNGVSSSFLKIVKSEVESGNEPCFDLEAVCEYLTLGNVYFDKTFYYGIHILPSTKIAVIERNGITVFQKQIGDIDEASSITSISEFFDKVAFSLSDTRVCQALTGGYDSRMVYACLSNRIMDHPAISANDPSNKDVKYAKMVATANNDDLEIVKISKPEFSENLIDILFEKKDGIMPLDIEGDIRLLTFKTALAKEHNIHLTGDGGVLHKDWEWIQDFPFYKKRKSNANQFYRQRLYNISIDNHIGEELRNDFERQAQRFTKALESIAKSINSQSYDSWYYRISGNWRTDYNCNPVDGLFSYAPLEELDIVRYSYALPRWKRFFYNSIRETITNENKKIARIKTNYGTNASNEWPYIIADVFFQSIEYMRKALRLIGRKIIRKNALNRSVLDWSLEKEVRDSDIAAKAVEYARQNRFIKPLLSLNNLSYSEIQRLIHIYCLFCFVTKQRQQSLIRMNQ